MKPVAQSSVPLMFSLLFLAEKTGKTQQSWSYSLGQADPPGERMRAADAVPVPPSRELILFSMCPPIRNFLQKVTVTTPVLILIDLHSRQAERMAGNCEFAVLKNQCIVLYSVLCHMHLTDSSSLFILLEFSIFASLLILKDIIHWFCC